MEEKKAAAYYDELTRKGEGAARFKQGLGYNSNPPSPSSSSSFLTTFVPASSSTPELQKQTQLLHSIQNKLSKSKNKHPSSSSSDRNLRHSRRTGEEEEEEEGNGLSRSRDRHREERDGSSRRSTERNGRDTARRRHSRSRDEEESPTSLGEGKHHHRVGSRRRRSRSSSPPSIRSERSRGDRVKGTSEKNLSKRTSSKDRNAGGIDYSQLIEGYAEMTPAERVKAKMKIQLSQTVAKDTMKGNGSGWERFDFNKEAPIDDEELEVAEDDAALVKDLGRSFRFSAVEAKREAEIKAAHDEAIFGSSAASPIVEEKVSTKENNVKEKTESCRNLMSDQVLAMQQGSWRDRARKLRDGSN